MLYSSNNGSVDFSNDSALEVDECDVASVGFGLRLDDVHLRFDHVQGALDQDMCLHGDGLHQDLRLHGDGPPMLHQATDSTSESALRRQPKPELVAVEVVAMRQQTLELLFACVTLAVFPVSSR